MVDFIVPPGQHAFSIRHDGRHRTGTWCVPHEWTPPHRLVLAFHGAGSCAADMMPFSGLQAWADHAGAVVAFLDGTGRRAGAYTWNGGPECGYAGRHRVDDLGFVERLMDETEAQLAASVTWLAVGMSNGGLFALRLAEQLSPRFPAVAAVAASTASGPLPPPPPCPVSVLFLHGTEDAFVPFQGGIGRSSLTRTPFRSIPDAIQQWVAWNQCDPHPEQVTLPRSVDDGTHVECVTYSGGRRQTSVQLYRIVGGGHTWPGRSSKYAFLGPTTQNITANDAIWEFFTNRARPD